jgi:hypothetical protein
MQGDDVAALQRELLHAREMAEAERCRGDELAAALEAANRGQDELRVLLLRQSEQLTLLLPAPRGERSEQPGSTASEQAEPRRRPMWRRWPWPRRV